MGLSTSELTILMPDIENFAEIGEFFDQPLRVYSSGMNARLAFALATAVTPDVLIVDEVLSVGDSYFQHKSFDRIRQFKVEGISIMMVTHVWMSCAPCATVSSCWIREACLKTDSPTKLWTTTMPSLQKKKTQNLALSSAARKMAGCLPGAERARRA